MFLADKVNCSGCTACANICPKQCIKMIPDDEGFLYPSIDEEKCIKCGACKSVCPIGKTEKHFPLGVYGIKNKNKDIRLLSTSGGVFSVLAEYVIERNGVVFGCKFNENLEAEHDFAESYQDVEAFRGAKYVQSKLNDAFKKVKKFLDEDRYVLFTGTPCQVAGLHFYLGKNYEKLIKCDLVCHSVPSPKAFELYIKEIEEKNSQKISEIFFRNKELNGWNKSNIKIIFGNGNIYKETLKETSFMKGFINGLYSRVSCANCTYKNFKGSSDITIADYWGIEKVDKDFDDNLGVSLVFANSQVGEKVIKQINDKIELIETSLEDSTLKNQRILIQAPMHEKRSSFFEKINDNNFSELVFKLLKND